nr:MAG TPA: hypothetical protein [Caudoviricetes sp.]
MFFSLCRPAPPVGVSKSLRLNNRATGVGLRVKKREIKRGINPRR